MPFMALSAVIFDLDGTLIDTNPAHVDAFEQAFAQLGYKVSKDRIAVEMGKGGDKLVVDILGEEIDRTSGNALRKAHTSNYIGIAKSRPLAVFPGVDGLLRGIRTRGLKLALATSSKPEELEATFASAGVDWKNQFDVITKSSDARQGKPAPDLVQVAVDKLGVSPAECLMIGDTPYDAQTARDAGVVCDGLTCGKMNDAARLRASGMRMVFDDPAHLLAQLDDVLRNASPGSSLLTHEMMQQLVLHAIQIANEAIEKGELPVGCVIARGDGTIIARGHNQQNATQNKISHGEIVAFNDAAGKVPLDAVDLILVSTLEPCVMCLGAAMEAAVDTVLFGLPAPHDQGTTRVSPPVTPETKMPRIVGNILRDECRELFVRFKGHPKANPQQVSFIDDLLKVV